MTTICYFAIRNVHYSRVLRHKSIFLLASAVEALNYTLYFNPIIASTGKVNEEIEVSVDAKIAVKE